MPARFFFHAPDNRVYGPVDFTTLQRWRAEGRVRDDSHIRAEGGTLLTYTEVAAMPPAPEPEPAPPVLPPVPEAAPQATPPPIPAAGFEEEPAPLRELLGHAVALYRENFLRLWLAGVAMHVPMLVIASLFPTLRHPQATQLQSLKQLSTEIVHNPALLVAIVFAQFLLEIFYGLLTALVRQADDGEAFSLAAAWMETRSRCAALIGTLLLRWVIILSFLFLGGACLMMSPGLSVAARGLLEIMALIFLVLAILLWFRYLPATQVVMLEKKSGLRALGRTGELVRFGGGPGFFSTGDFRLVACLGFITAFFCAILFASLLFVLLASSVFGMGILQSAAFSVVVNVALAAAIIPLIVIVFVLFVRDARRRVPDPDAAAKPADPAP